MTTIQCVSENTAAAYYMIGLVMGGGIALLSVWIGMRG